MTDETVPPSQAALASLGLSPADLARLAPADAERVLELLRAYDETVAKENARKSFMDFTRYIWPEIEAQEFIEGPHHRRVAAALQRVVDGTCKRLIVCLPPRHTKSAMVSKALPLYFFGQRPNGKVMQASNVKDLADKFGRVVRDTMRTARFRAIFPETELLSTSAAAGIWSTTRGGEYFAVGTGGAAAGRGGDLIIIDDPHKDEEGMLGIYRPEVFDFAYDWFRTTPLQRLQPNGSIVICVTRWSKRDLVGQILENDHRGEWEVIEFPALLPSGAPLWPQFWAKEELEAKREDVGAIRWNAQYQQNPTAVEVAMVRQEDWQPWSDTRDALKPLPKFEYVVQAWDTAFSAKTSANYSACTTWGVFEHRDAKTNKPRPGIMLVDAWRGRVEYPELKRHAKELYAKWEPDTLLIEARASGSPLIQDLRASGLPATDVNIARGASRTSNDKVTRVHAITDLFRSRYVWYRPGPDTNEVISEFLDFPAGASDDLVDSSTHALAFAKRLVLDYKIRAADEEEDDNATVRRAHNRYRRI